MAELHLKVFADRSELVRPDGQTETFDEGPTSADARERYRRIKARLSDGYLDEQIVLCKERPGSIGLDRMDEEQTQLLDELVSSMGSEVGRALIGLMVLQLCVKAIEPTQSIRLHKGGPSASNFSWRDGISMRNHGISISMMSLKEWVGLQFDRALQTGLVEEDELASHWISAYAESLSLRRLDQAPVDEPCHQWLSTLHPILENLRNTNRKENS